MSKSEKQIVKESERNRKILETAFRIFVERKIEPVSMGEIAEAAFPDFRQWALIAFS